MSSNQNSNQSSYPESHGVQKVTTTEPYNSNLMILEKAILTKWGHQIMHAPSVSQITRSLQTYSIAVLLEAIERTPQNLKESTGPSHLLNLILKVAGNPAWYNDNNHSPIPKKPEPTMEELLAAEKESLNNYEKLAARTIHLEWEQEQIAGYKERIKHLEEAINERNSRANS